LLQHLSSTLVPYTTLFRSKLEQPEPRHRSTRYPATATLSVDAVQARLICVPLVAEAVRLDGADGGTRSGGVALAVLEYPLRLARSEEHTSELQSLAYLVCR